MLPAKPGLTLRGLSDSAPHADTDVNAFSLDGAENNRKIGPQQFPRRSGDMLYFAGNGRYNSFIQPSMSVSEASGSLARTLKKQFGSSLVRLGDARHEVEQYDVFPGPVGQIQAYSTGSSGGLPLMSTTSKGYSPFEYPELVDRAGYFYLATSRPGFPIFFAVADSTISENYWFNQYASYENTVGAAQRGDQPNDVYWSVISGMFADRARGRAFYGRYSSGGVAVYRGDEHHHSGPAFGRPVARINGEDLGIYAGVGPAPGTVYETGAVKGVGSVAVPMVPHDARIDVHLPGGAVHRCRGRADAVGNFACPAGPLKLDLAGAYHVESSFEQGERRGTCVGARGGRYKFYVVHRDSRHHLRFSRPSPGPVQAGPLTVSGSVAPIIRGRAHYSVVAPGILLDQGVLKLENGKFSMRVFPRELMAQYPNLHDHDGSAGEPQWSRLLSLAPNPDMDNYRKIISGLLSGPASKKLSDTVEVTVFVEGKDAAGKPATAAGKLVLRGSRVVIPLQFQPARVGAR